MDIAKILLATLFMTLGQIGSFMQLQGSIKYGWSEKYLWLLLLSGIFTYKDSEVKFGLADWLGLHWES
jgi:hypothetical protein